MDQTVNFNDLTLEQRISLVGEPVTIGVYTKTEHGEGEIQMSLTGVLVNILEKPEGVQIETEHNGSIHWINRDYTALVSWIDYRL